MARFNAVSPEQVRVQNEAGGLGYTKSPKLELALLVLTSFVKDQFYRTAGDQMKRLRELVPMVGTEFAAKAALYARREAGMRSITHVLAAEIANQSKREPWLRPFFARIARRPDDVLEILSLWGKGPAGKPLRKLPKAMQRGLADAFAQWDEYQLAKYRAEGKAINLMDAVRVLHVKPTEKNATALEKLVKGELVSTQTWEAKLTTAGQKAKGVAAETGKTEEEAALELKAEAWADLLGRKKLGYFALLRNLRNIMQQAPEALPTALADLVDEDAIRKSLLMPFRFQTAYTEMQNVSGSQKVLAAISQAATIAVKNVPEFPGRTLVALDGSSSMGSWSGSNPSSPWSIGRMFAAAMVLRNEADLLVWGSTGAAVSISPDLPVLGAAESLDAVRARINDGTQMRLVFDYMHKQAKAGVLYDRVVILTDNQSWVGDTVEGRTAYLKAAGKLPNIWIWDLQGYSTLQLKEHSTFVMGGFSDKALAMLVKVEAEPAALIKEIEAIEIVKALAPEADTEEAPAS